MKPTAQLSSQHSASSPFTDYHYQSTLDASCASPEERRGAHQLHGFWRLSTAFFGAEAIREDVTEFSVFTVIALISAWPILMNIVAVIRLLKAV